MKLKSLLTAVSLVAISASSANALSITGISPAGIIPALELQLPGSPALTAPYTFTLTTDSGFYPAGNNVLVNITLPGGVAFTAPVTGASVAGGSAVVQSGGAVGNTTVQLLVSIVTPGLNALTFNVNLGLNACPTPGSNLVITANIDGSGTPIEQGVASSGGLIAPCASGLNGVVGPDATNTTISLASSYLQINESGGAATLGPLPIGSLNYSVNAAVSTSIAATTPIVGPNINNATFDVVFEDASQVTLVELVLAGGATIAGTLAGNTASFDVNVPADILTLIDGTADTIQVTVAGTGTIPTQTVAVNNSFVNFSDLGGPDMIPTEAGASGPIDPLEREGQNFGVFDWNGQNAAGTLSIYRVTGLTMPTAYTVILTNAGAANGTYTGTATPNANGEVIISSADFGLAMPPAYTRADAQFIFETPNPTDMDRVLVRNDIISDFGGGANIDLTGTALQPTGDSDTGTAE